MQGLAPSDIFLFEDFRLDRGGSLFQSDQSGAFVPVAIGSRALDILGVLIDRAGEVVSKDEITAAVWPGTLVDDSNLTVQISALRRALDNGGSNGSCIQTVARRGYRFVAAVTHPAAEARSFAVNGKADSAEEGEPKLVADLLTSDMPIAALSRRRTASIAIAAAVGAVLAVAVSASWLWPATKPPPAPLVAAATSISQPLAAPRLSIVVLPFANLSGDPDQQYLADGITEDVTTDLSRISDSFVISRNTAFTYRNKSIDTRQIGRELGVRYVLEGNVRRSGDKVRVVAQLIDAETDAHLWAEQFDGDMGDLFTLQDEVTSRLANSLGFELIGREATRPTEHPDALDYIMRGRAARLRPHSRDAYAERVSMFEHALTLDPRSVEAQSQLASSLAGGVLDLMTGSATADIERAKRLAEQALAASPRSPLAHYAKGQVLRAQRRYAEAIPEYETVLATDRNWASVSFALGQCKLYAGSIEETIPLVERAIRLSPRDPGRAVWYWQIGVVHLLQSRTNEAIIWFENARNANPALAYVHAWLAAAYGLNGESERAAAALAEARRLSERSWPSIAGMRRGIGSWGVPKIRALFEPTFFAGLRKAGMPEE